MDPMFDLNVPKEVRVFLIAADGAANRGDWDGSRELLKKAKCLTSQLAKRTKKGEENVENDNRF